MRSTRCHHIFERSWFGHCTSNIGSENRQVTGSGHLLSMWIVNVTRHSAVRFNSSSLRITQNTFIIHTGFIQKLNPAVFAYRDAFLRNAIASWISRVWKETRKVVFLNTNLEGSEFESLVQFHRTVRLLWKFGNFPNVGLKNFTFLPSARCGLSITPVS